MNYEQSEEALDSLKPIGVELTSAAMEPVKFYQPPKDKSGRKDIDEDYEYAPL